MLTAIVDLQFGSTGKGLLAGFLSQKHNYDMVISANMPNAGHTFVDAAGRAWVNKVLPSGAYSRDLRYIGVGPGAVFDPQQLVKEITMLRERGILAKVVIHEGAALLKQEHRDFEAKNLSEISSTMQGSMAAMLQKMCRSTDESNICGMNKALLQDIEVECDDESLWASVVPHRIWKEIVASCSNVLLEGSQGYSLGINAGFYPYCTSRDCTVWRLIADCGVSPKSQLRVIGTARCHPIRVGNTPDGYSGGWYEDQQELSWEQLGQTPEKTTVTQRVRRVASFSEMQIKEAMEANRVDEVFLNFCNYNPREALWIRNRIDGMAPDLFSERFNQAVFGPNGYPKLVKYMGFGPQAEDVLDLSED